MRISEKVKIAIAIPILIFLIMFTIYMFSLFIKPPARPLTTMPNPELVEIIVDSISSDFIKVIIKNNSDYFVALHSPLQIEHFDYIMWRTVRPSSSIVTMGGLPSIMPNRYKEFYIPLLHYRLTSGRYRVRAEITFPDIRFPHEFSDSDRPYNNTNTNLDISTNSNTNTNPNPNTNSNPMTHSRYDIAATFRLRSLYNVQ